MTDTETILQCGMCHRQHDGKGTVLPFRVCVPVLQGCGREDCEVVVANQLAAGKEDRINRMDRIKTGPDRQDKISHGGQLRQRTAAGSPAPARRVCEDQLPPSDRVGAPEGGWRMENGGLDRADKATSALDYETSANARLLEFFQVPGNFGKWFAAKFLEDEVGRTSGRMNNRAIWLRSKLNPGGLELDQHNCPPGENLPAGSYYRLCRIEEALRLTDEEKRKLIQAPAERFNAANGGYKQKASE